MQEASAYAEENSLLFMETSAKTAMNVNDIFLAIGDLQLFPFTLMVLNGANYLGTVSLISYMPNCFVNGRKIDEEKYTANYALDNGKTSMGKQFRNWFYFNNCELGKWLNKAGQ